ncbi:MAG: hypothetical protein Kow00107_11070 [Planctomycetota bacterium]
MLEAENQQLRSQVDELKNQLASKSASDEKSITRVLRLVKEKNELVSRLSEKEAMLSRRVALLSKSCDALRTENERARTLLSCFRQMFDALPIAVVCVDTAGSITFANSPAKEKFSHLSPLEGKDVRRLELDGHALGIENIVLTLLRTESGTVSMTIRVGSRRLRLKAALLVEDEKPIGASLVFF